MKYVDVLSSWVCSLSPATSPLTLRWESGQVRATPGRWRESTFPLLEMSVAPELTGFEDEVIEMLETEEMVGRCWKLLLSVYLSLFLCEAIIGTSYYAVK